MSTAGDRFESNAVDVITSVAEVAEEHLVLISRILEMQNFVEPRQSQLYSQDVTYLTLHALFAVRALPLVAGDVADQVEGEANTGGVARGVALRAVQ